MINLSLVGPPNQALERVVGAMVKGGHLLVAAVGNDGPAAPPLYPASYPGVVGVSGVDPRGPRPAGSGARPAGDVRRARQQHGQRRARRAALQAGARHLVRLAAGRRPAGGRHGAPDKAQAAAAVAALAKQAARSDGATVSNETGYGIVGAALRVDPATFR